MARFNSTDKETAISSGIQSKGGKQDDMDDIIETFFRSCFDEVIGEEIREATVKSQDFEPSPDQKIIAPSFYYDPALAGILALMTIRSKKKSVSK